jgi:hypothetical protein
MLGLGLLANPNSKGIIRDSEIISQTSYAYSKSYAGYGCDSEAMKPFCEPSCPVRQWRESKAIASVKAEEHKEKGI